MELQQVSSELLALRNEVKAIEERQKEELEPKKKMLTDLQGKFIEMLQAQGMKSIKTDEANFALTTRKGYSVVNEAQARTWAKENNVFSIDKRLMAQKLKEVESIPDFLSETESVSLTVKPVA